MVACMAAAVSSKVIECVHWWVTAAAVNRDRPEHGMSADNSDMEEPNQALWTYNGRGIIVQRLLAKQGEDIDRRMCGPWQGPGRGRLMGWQYIVLAGLFKKRPRGP